MLFREIFLRVFRYFQAVTGEAKARVNPGDRPSVSSPHTANQKLTADAYYSVIPMNNDL